MTAFSQENCDGRHRRMKTTIVGIASLVSFVLLGGIGWALFASESAIKYADEAKQDTHAIETKIATFQGRQDEFNKHATTTLKRIDDKVDAMWRHNGGGKGE